MVVDLTSFWLTLKLAFLTAIILLLVCLPLAWKLSNYQGKAKPLLEALIALPLVLPPTVLGFYLLTIFSPNSTLGKLWISVTGEQLVFSFSGILLGSLFYSLPFVMQPLLAGFNQMGQQYNDVAACLGISAKKRFLYITLQLLKPSIISAFTLGFAHTLGEFGLVLMIGGNIPGETQVVAIELYDHVESLNYAAAHQLSLLLVSLSFICLALLFYFNRPVLGLGTKHA